MAVNGIDGHGTAKEGHGTDRNVRAKDRQWHDEQGKGEVMTRVDVQCKSRERQCNRQQQKRDAQMNKDKI